MTPTRDSEFVLGTRVHLTNFPDATQQIIAWATQGESRYVCAANVHMIMEAHDSERFQEIVNGADLIAPDGMPLVWAQYWQGRSQAERVDGPTLMWRVCAAAATVGLPIGLYGSTDVSLAEFEKVVKRAFPQVQIACAIAPPFRQLTLEEDDAIVQRIRDSGTRILLVCLGCPKQERWMAAHRGRIPAVMLGIGAAVDFHSGRVARAPQWIQRVGFEWLFRLLMEPKRLFPRYLKHNPRFLGLLLAQLLLGKNFQPRPERQLRILLAGYLPPPAFGPSVTYAALLNSVFAKRFAVTFLDLTVVREFGELERFQVRKVFKTLGLAVKQSWQLVTRKFDFCCVPISLNRNAFLRDALVLFLARCRGVPTVVYAHGNQLPEFRDGAPRWLQRLIDHTLHSACGAIVLGNTLRFNAARWLPADRIFVVPTGIQPAAVVTRTAGARPIPTVLYLGNLVVQKGVMILLEAAALLAARQVDARFVFAGSWHAASDEAAARELVRAQRLEDRVQFIGPVSGQEKSKVLAEADVLAFPTFYPNETMGLVLLEAMQAGLPVVTTRRGSIPEIIQDGTNGLLVDEQNPADLAEKLERLIQDPARRLQIGRANQERFQQFYTHEQFGERMIAAFETLQAQVIAARQPPATITIFGVPIDNLTLAETITQIEKFITAGPTHQHVVVNVDKIVKMHQNAALRASILQCDLINPDGMPIVWASRLLGCPLKERVTGIDLFEKLIHRSAERGYRVYLLGAEPHIVEKTASVLRDREPGLRLVGWHHGYWTPAEEPALVERIVVTRPDMLFVALNSPKKELFITKWRDRLQVPFVMGVGGSFDVLAGKVRRAPHWMQRSGLEWLYRLMQEPKRMWRRYLIEDVAFIPIFWREWRQRRLARRHRPEAS